MSTDTTGPSPTWDSETVSPLVGLTDISCPSAALCVVDGGDDNLYVSTNPSAADPTWTAQGVTNELRDSVYASLHEGSAWQWASAA